MTYLPEIKSRDMTTYGSAESRSSGLAPWVPGRPVLNTGYEEIISQCHTGQWPPRRRTQGDIGGIMSLKRSGARRTPVDLYSHVYRGQTAIAQVNAYVLGSSPASSASTSVLNAFGTSAIAKVLPTNPNASLATALGELKQEGLPSIPGASFRDRADLARKAGHEYLNVEFGWLPLVRDLQDFAKSVRRSRELIDQYRRDSDRKIRRRFVAIPQETTSTFTGTASWYTGGGSLFAPCTVTKTTTTRYWFSGAFRYHVPVGDDVYSRLRRYESYANHLFGTRITPELVWNLAPWSWAIDWFTNAGDVLHNISTLGSDGLVMQYGYAMRHMRVQDHVQSSFDFTDQVGRHYGYGTLDVVSERKQRQPAHPYGFGIDDLSLSKRQLAILAALGLTKSKRDWAT